jgi:uncharacterized protein (DUF305 family)
LRAFHIHVLYILASLAPLGGIDIATADARGELNAGAIRAENGTNVAFFEFTGLAMTRMMEHMAIKPSGDTDRDFVAMMVPHHQGAIDMAEAELLFGNDALLKRIAQGLIVEQIQEIAAMQMAVGEPATPTWVVDPQAQAAPAAGSIGREAPYLWQNFDAMRTMTLDMAVVPSGDTDRDFIAMMVPHHEGGIGMAEAELRYGRNPVLLSIAQEIIVDQQQEIGSMRLALGEPLPSATAAPTQLSAAIAMPLQPSPRTILKWMNALTPCGAPGIPH